MTDKIELYNEGEYCEAVIEGETCLDRYSNAPCNPCLRRIENINLISDSAPPARRVKVRC